MNDGNLPAGKKPETVGRVLRRNFPAFLSVAVFSLGINLLMLTGPIFMLQIYSRVLPAHSTSTLIVLFALVLFLFAVLGLMDIIRNRVLGRAAVRLSLSLRDRLFDSVMDLSLRKGGAPQAARPMQEFEIISNFLSGPALTAFYDAPMIPVYLFIIYLFHPMLFWFAVFATLLLFLFAVLTDIISRRPQAQSLQASEKAQRLMSAGLRNIEAMRALGMLSNLRERWKNEHDAALWHQTRLRDSIGGMTASSKALRLLIQSTILAIGAWLAIKGEITSGVMVAASIILGRALQPVELAITNWRVFRRYRIARRRVDDVLRETSRREDKHTTPEPDTRGNLEASQLFAAPPGARKPFLQNISFRLPAGKMLVLTGPNGSGKTMLARILTGVWEPLGGGVLLDGADLRTWPSHVLGRLTGYVPQDVELVDGTIAENIARLDRDVREEDIIGAARKAGVHEAIKKMGGYDIQVGPGGAFLSAGQRQRIALARALYGDPVFIVLDEPNSNLDAEGRAALLKALRGMRQRGQTVVLVDHDDKALRMTDFILVLKDGKIAAGGPRDKVLKARARKAPAIPAGQDRHSGKSEGEYHET